MPKRGHWIDEDPSSRAAGLLSTDVKHWAEIGITTPAQLDRYQNECAYSEIYKSWTGCRPGSVAHLSDEELEAEITSVACLARAEMDREAAYEKANLDEVIQQILEVRETVENATDADCIRIWIDSLDLDNFDKMYGWERIEWLLHIPFKSLQKLYGDFNQYCEVNYEY